MLRKTLKHALANSLLCLLLLTTLVWGGCVSCEQYFMFGGTRSCCSPNGHCKTKKTPTQSAARECNQIAFDHRKPADFHIDLPVISEVEIALSVSPAEAMERCRIADLIEPSPPDLQVLHSTFLI